MEKAKEYKCDKCGRNFRLEHHLHQHNRRKTPCIIVEVPVAVKDNPNRCIYCNKVYSRKPNLVKHQKNCELKNGGVERLPDKIKLEETIRIMSEERAKEKEETHRLLAEMLSKIEKLEARDNVRPIVNANIDNSTTNINVTNNFTINSVNKVNYAYLLELDKFKELFSKAYAGLPIAIVRDLY